MKINDFLGQVVCDEYKIHLKRTDDYIICRSKSVVEKYFGWMMLDSDESIIPEGESLVLVVDDDKIDYFLDKIKDI